MGQFGRPPNSGALAALCVEHDLILLPDEIHCDLVFDGAKHTPTITAAPEIADRLDHRAAATKTFNLAGAHVGACIAWNATLKHGFDARIAASGLGSYNRSGMIAIWRRLGGQVKCGLMSASFISPRAAI